MKRLVLITLILVLIFNLLGGCIAQTGIPKLSDQQTERVQTFAPTTTSVPNQAPELIAELINVKMGNTNGNIVNGGLVAEQDGWVYFSYSDWNSESDSGLYKMKEDTAEKIKISNINARSINVIDEWLYCINHKDFGIYKMSTNGKDVQRLGSDEVLQIIVVDNWIYYKNHSSELYKIDISGANQTQIITEQVRDFNVHGEFIYYSTRGVDSNDIYTIKTDRTGKQKLFTCYNPEPIRGGLIVKSGWVYYLKRDGLYRTKTNGLEEAQISVGDGICFNILDDSIYCVCTDGIIKMRLDGSNSMKISTDRGWEIYNAGNSIWLLEECDQYYELFKMKLDGTDRQTIINLK